ncbi:hypothetical protein [Kribbella sp. NPDC050459]
MDEPASQEREDHDRGTLDDADPAIASPTDISRSSAPELVRRWVE